MPGVMPGVIPGEDFTLLFPQIFGRLRGKVNLPPSIHTFGLELCNTFGNTKSTVQDNRLP